MKKKGKKKKQNQHDHLNLCSKYVAVLNILTKNIRKPPPHNKGHV